MIGGPVLIRRGGRWKIESSKKQVARAVIVMRQAPHYLTMRFDTTPKRKSA